VRRRLAQRGILPRHRNFYIRQVFGTTQALTLFDDR